MVLNINHLVQALASLARKRKLPRDPSVLTAKLNFFEAGNAVPGATINWCVVKRGYDVIISISGRCPNVESLQLFRLPNMSCPFFKRKLLCMYLALANAVHAVCRNSEAVEKKSKFLSTGKIGDSLTLLHDNVQRLKTNLELQKVKDALIDSFKSKKLDLDCVILVYLFCKRHLGYSFYVNTTHGLIIDSCELYPMIPATKSLSVCVGGRQGSSRVDKVPRLSNYKFHLKTENSRAIKIDLHITVSPF